MSTQNLRLGNTVFVDIIQIRIKMRTWIMVGPKSNESVLIRDRREQAETQKGHMKTETETGARGAWIHQELEEARRMLP